MSKLNEPYIAKQINQFADSNPRMKLRVSMQISVKYVGSLKLILLTSHNLNQIVNRKMNSHRYWQYSRCFRDTILWWAQAKEVLHRNDKMQV